MDTDGQYPLNIRSSAGTGDIGDVISRISLMQLSHRRNRLKTVRKDLLRIEQCEMNFR